MAGTALERMGLAGLARATQTSLDWKNWTPGARRRDVDETRPSAEVLDKLIEAEIIPRLMLTTRESADALWTAESAPAPQPVFDAAQIDAFARKAVNGDPEVLVRDVNALLDAGASHEDVLLRLLAPAARRLGKMWDEDTCDFADVTIGLMKLHRVLERVNADAPCGMGAGGSSPRVLLSPAPGEQHVFGVVMVGEFFARSGWRVQCESLCTTAHLMDQVADQHYDVIGLSVSAEINVKEMRTAIRSIRGASCNPDIVIMVGGQVFNEDAGLAKRIGADATAADGVRAVVTAERLVHKLARAGRALQQ